jgi:hypothetical protein
MQAVQTNIIGTENVLDSAIEHGVKKIVALSTDKACYPINAMGISKAMMEKVVIAKGRSFGADAQTTICATRYGNVMASRGSVIPLWIEQIKAKREITITDPAMTRFMMTLDDTVDLVLYAFSHGHNGDFFIQKAPAATLETLVRALKDLYHVDSVVRVIGTAGWADGHVSLTGLNSSFEGPFGLEERLAGIIPPNPAFFKGGTVGSPGVIRVIGNGEAPSPPERRSEFPVVLGVALGGGSVFQCGYGM